MPHSKKPFIYKVKISPRVQKAIDEKEPLHWSFTGLAYLLLSGDEQIAMRYGDETVLRLQQNLLANGANIDPGAVNIAVNE